MKRFIIRSVLFFVFAAVVSVGVFLLYVFYLPVSKSLPSESSITDAIQESKNAASDVKSAALEKVAESIPESGIPLSSLSLSETQKKALAAAQIDVESFTVTKTMLFCAAEKVGEERLNEIMAGSSPTVIEMTKLIPCLRS